MSLVATQSLVTVTGKNLVAATRKLDESLKQYADARVIALTSQANWATSFGSVTILAAIEYAASPTPNTQS